MTDGDRQGSARLKPPATSTDSHGVGVARTYCSAESRAVVVRRALWFVVAVDVLSFGLATYRLELVDKALDGDFDAATTLVRSDGPTNVLTIAGVVATLTAMVVFIRWFLQAYRNAAALDPDTVRYGTRWAIWSWFVPILGLFRPKQMANDVWRASRPRGERTDDRSGHVSWLMTAWWVMFLTSTWVWNFFARLSFQSEPADPVAAAEQFRQELGVELAANLFDVAAAVLAIVVVGRMTTRQDTHASRIRTEQETRSAAVVRTAR